VHGLFVSCECLVIISGVVNLQTFNMSLCTPSRGRFVMHICNMLRKTVCMVCSCRVNAL
jgi:hypothetical protein